MPDRLPPDFDFSELATDRRHHDEPLIDAGLILECAELAGIELTDGPEDFLAAHELLESGRVADAIDRLVPPETQTENLFIGIRNAMHERLRENVRDYKCRALTVDELDTDTARRDIEYKEFLESKLDDGLRRAQRACRRRERNPLRRLRGGRTD